MIHQSGRVCTRLVKALARLIALVPAAEASDHAGSCVREVGASL